MEVKEASGHGRHTGRLVPSEIGSFSTARKQFSAYILNSNRESKNDLAVFFYLLGLDKHKKLSVQTAG